MSEAKIIKLKRRDNLNTFVSNINIYDTRLLTSLDKQNEINILRIIKKSILGCNFCYSYAKNNIFASAIANFVIINTCFVIFPQIIFNSINMNKIIEDIDNKKLLQSNGNDFLFRLSISNFIDISILTILGLIYKYREKEINKYMKIYTQCAIKEENDILIKNKIFCKITEDNFDIEIKKPNKYFIENKNKQEYFFKYMINFPNVIGINKFLYNKYFTAKEKEIIYNINSISEEVDYKYKKKLLKFILIIVSILIFIPFFSYISDKKKLDVINYIGIFSLFLFVQFNISLKNKKEQINYISLLNERYIKDGYFIYINKDIISIFYLKEEYRINNDIYHIYKINENFMKKYNLI